MFIFAEHPENRKLTNYTRLDLQDIHAHHQGERGIKWVSDLYSSTNMKPFADLQLEYGLPTSEQFNYIPITSYLKSNNTPKYNLFW